MSLWLTKPDAATFQGRYRACMSVLSADERAQHDRFVSDADRRLYAASHAMLRGVCGREVGVDPRHLRLVRNRHGRPRLEREPVEGVQFNLSHTRGLAALVLTRGLECGIDVEYTGVQLDPLAVARTVFSDDEQSQLRIRSPSARRARFFELWTLKEAYIKARGLGMALELRDFGFFDSDGADERIWFERSISDDPDGWWFERRTPTPEHVLALAIRSRTSVAVSEVSFWLPPLDGFVRLP